MKTAKKVMATLFDRLPKRHHQWMRAHWPRLYCAVVDWFWPDRSYYFRAYLNCPKRNYWNRLKAKYIIAPLALMATVAIAVPVANKPLIGNGTVGANNIVTARCIAKQQIVNLTVTVNGAVNTSYEANWTDLNTMVQGSGSTFAANVGDMVGVTVGWAQPLPKGSSVRISLA